MSSPMHARYQLTYTQAAQFTLDVDLTLPSQGVTALFGHSGSGKTTLLRCIAGLQAADRGLFSLSGELWQDANYCLPTHQRPLGYVFQEASLFAHLNARQNLEFALKRATPGRPIAQWEEAIELLGIEHLLNQPAHSLSGGERQRIAIARALLINPKLLLMDEPLAALDMRRKQEILPYLERLKNELKIPIIYVSHSIDEVARLADHLVILEAGKVQRQGPLQQCLASIDNPFLFADKSAEETSVVIEGQVVEIDEHYLQLGLQCSAGMLWLQGRKQPLGSRLRVRIQARDISLSLQRHEDTSINNILPATVIDYRTMDADGTALVRLAVGSDIFISKITRRSLQQLAITEGQPLWAQIKGVALVH